MKHSNIIPAFSQLATISLLGASFLLCGCQSPSTHSIGSMQLIETQANLFTSSTQSRASLDVLPGGNIVTAWDSRRQQEGSYGIYARMLNAVGQPISNEIQVNQHTTSHQTRPTVATAADGSVMIAWNSFGQDGDAGSIVMRRFDAAMNPLTDELAVNQTQVGHQANPSIAINARGSMLIAWTIYDETGQSQIVARMFDQHGIALTDELPLPKESNHRDTLPVVTALPNNDGFAVCYARTIGNSPTTSSIIGSRINVDGSYAAADYVLTDAMSGSHIEPAIDVNEAGNIIVGWLTATEHDHQAVVAVFDREFEMVSSPEIITPEDARWVSGIAVAANGNKHVVSWNQANADIGKVSVFAKMFHADNQPIGSTFAMTTPVDDGYQFSEIASNAKRLVWSVDDQLALAWSGAGNTDDDSAARVSVRISQQLAAESTTTRLAMAGALSNSDNFDTPIPPVWNAESITHERPIYPEGNQVGFLGVADTGWNPPDPEIAVGPNHIVTMTNGAIAFLDKQGNLLFQDEIENDFGFWGDLGADNFVFDPECLWDPHAGRFFAMACERSDNGRSYYLVAVSDDANPMGTWHKYRIDVTNVDNDIDSPNMAIDENVLYLTADFFGPDKYQVLMIEKTPLLSGGSVNSEEIVITGSGNQSMGIPIIHDTNAPAAYLIQSSEGTGNGVNFNEVRFHAIQNQLTNPTRVTVDVNVPTYAYPNQPPQAGTSVRPFLFEPRFWSCTYINGSLWAVHHVNSNRVRVRWYEFEMNGWPNSGSNPTLRQSGELDYGSGIHTYFPSIAVDDEGNAAIVFARSSTSEFISFAGAYRAAGDPLGTFRDMETLRDSTSPANFASRWGDYSHIEYDPATPGRFWGTHEWTDNSTSWRTWIAPLDNPTELADATAFTITRGSLLSGDLASLLASDNSRLRMQSQFGFLSSEPNVAEIEVTFDFDNASATSLDLTFEHSVNNPGGTATIAMRNYATNAFQTVDTYNPGTTDQVDVTNLTGAGDFVRNSDGQVRVRSKYVVIATFSLSGFIARIDQIKVEGS